MSTIDSLLDSIELPKVVKVKQYFDNKQISSIEESIAKEFAKKEYASKFKKGMKVAIAVGSRGIADLPTIVKSVIVELKKLKTNPFIVPAMGSHGGGTASGQKKILEDMGISEEFLEVPIISSLSTVQVATTKTGLPVHMDELAYKADSTIVINRIHPHVSYRGDYESGLMKMVAIGLGKLKGANICHDLGFGEMAKNVVDIGQECISNSNISLGIAILENAYHKVNDIIFVPADDIKIVEPKLLNKARTLEPKLFTKDLDVLILQEIGKNIAGSGFDTNIIGRYGTPYVSGGPKITKFGILDVTDVSYGNCTGVGMAEFTTQRLFKKFSFEDTYPNSLTSTVQVGIRIPMVLKNDKQVFQAAIKTSNIKNKDKVRLLFLKNTLTLDQFYISESLLEEASKNSNIEIVENHQDLKFDKEGNIDNYWQ